MKMRSTRSIAVALVVLVGSVGLGGWLASRTVPPEFGHALKLDVPLDAEMTAHRQLGSCTLNPRGGCTIVYSIVIHAASDDLMYARDCYFTPFDGTGRALHGALPFPTIAGIGIMDGVGRERGGMWVPDLLRSEIRHTVRWGISCTAFRWDGAIPV